MSQVLEVACGQNTAEKVNNNDDSSDENDSEDEGGNIHPLYKFATTNAKDSAVVPLSTPGSSMDYGIFFFFFNSISIYFILSFLIRVVYLFIF